MFFCSRTLELVEDNPSTILESRNEGARQLFSNHERNSGCCTPCYFVTSLPWTFPRKNWLDDTSSAMSSLRISRVMRNWHLDSVERKSVWFTLLEQVSGRCGSSRTRVGKNLHILATTCQLKVQRKNAAVYQQPRSVATKGQTGFGLPAYVNSKQQQQKSIEGSFSHHECHAIYIQQALECKLETL